MVLGHRRGRQKMRADCQLVIAAWQEKTPGKAWCWDTAGVGR